ncbi:MAG: alpha/beta hydrolase [Candidatus Moranbacteria bacterium]|nr:alpha/beta hydrolase [Candidatus Moranbacteria bacterium]
MEMAAHYPERISHLILINSTTHKGYPIFKKDEKGQMLLGQTYQSPEELGTDPIQVIPLLNAQKEQNFQVMNYVFDLTIYTVKKPDPTWNTRWINESLKQKNLIDADWALATLNMSDQPNNYSPGENTISRIKCPTLHTWGTKDIVVPETMVLDNINALEKQSTYIIYEDCGHSPLVDVPDQLAKDIQAFITH